METAKLIVLLWLALSICLTIYRVGQIRKVKTPGMAVAEVIEIAIVMIVIGIYWQ